MIIGWILLVVVVLILARDFNCRYILEKAIPEYKNNRKKIIPGYNIYMYEKWIKEITK